MMLKVFRISSFIIIMLVLVTTITACQIKYSLDVIIVGGQGQVTPTSGTYTDGSEVTIVAVPASGWKFDRWEGDVLGNQNPLAQVRMDSDKIVLAYFVEGASPVATPTPTTPGGETGAPKVGSPENGATITDTTPLFTWTKIASATNYELQVATNPAFNAGDIIIHKMLGDVSVYQSENELVVGIYYWRIRGTNPSTDAASPWSFGSFAIDTEAQGW